MVHSDSDLILHNSSVLIDKEPFFLRFNSKRDSLLVKFSRPKRHPTKGVSQWIIILENYSD
ncbi:hypothetical protein CR198_12160 [Enterococcus faecium]|nr:hypothetical protein CR198_12160 [Enterococcus faecium]